jgi:hypothetical protein
MPLYVSRAGRCVFNGTDVVDDDDPDISTCVVRVHGVVKADGYEGLPTVVSSIEIDADYGNIIYTTTDNSRHSVPIVSRKLDHEMRKLRSDLDEMKLLLKETVNCSRNCHSSVTFPSKYLYRWQDEPLVSKTSDPTVWLFRYSFRKYFGHAGAVRRTVDVS